MRTILNKEPLHPNVKKILDDYFGEALEDSETEIQLRKDLYEPMSRLVFGYEEDSSWNSNLPRFM